MYTCIYNTVCLVIVQGVVHNVIMYNCVFTLGAKEEMKHSEENFLKDDGMNVTEHVRDTFGGRKRKSKKSKCTVC